MQQISPDGGQGQEGGSAGTLLLQIADATLGNVLVFHNDILHGSTQCGFDGHPVFRLHADQLCHTAVNAADPAAFPGTKNLLDAPSKALHAVFQILQQPSALLLFPQPQGSSLPILPLLGELLHLAVVQPLIAPQPVFLFPDPVLRLLQLPGKLLQGGFIGCGLLCLPGGGILAPLQSLLQLGDLLPGGLLGKAMLALLQIQGIHRTACFVICLAGGSCLLLLGCKCLLCLLDLCRKVLCVLLQLCDPLLLCLDALCQLCSGKLLCRMAFLRLGNLRPAVLNIIFADCNIRLYSGAVLFDLQDLSPEPFHPHGAFLHPGVALCNLGFLPVNIVLQIFIFRRCHQGLL